MLRSAPDDDWGSACQPGLRLAVSAVRDLRTLGHYIQPRLT
jgi:hypothetical protein